VKKSPREILADNLFRVGNEGRVFTLTHGGLWGEALALRRRPIAGFASNEMPISRIWLGRHEG